MKKLFLILFAVFSLLFITACGSDSNKEENNDHQDGTVTSSVISVYDEEMNMVGSYSYSATVNNTIDVSAFQKEGYKFDGIFDINLGIMLFNANGFQAPTVMLDTNYNAVLRYSPITYQLVFEANEGQLENSLDYIRNISYGEAVGLFPAPKIEGMNFDGWFDENGNRFSTGITPVYTKLTTDGFVLSGEIIKLYAQYTTKYCKVRLMCQDGSNDIQLEVQYGQMLPDLSEYFKDTGSRTIVGFGVSPSSTVSFNDPVYTDIELYAIWQEYKNVSFVYSDTVTKVERVYREGNLSYLADGERKGYVFEGWYSSSLLSGNKIASVPFSGLADTYYAKWSVGSYTIQFVAGGNLIGSSTYDINNTEITIPEVPLKNHYTGQWEEFELDFKDAVINAVYIPDDIRLTLLTGAEYSYSTIKWGEAFELFVPTKKGYEFKGWYYKGEPITDSDGKSAAPYTFETEITLEAKWVGIKCYLYFETHGGSAVQTTTADYGTPYTLTQKPTRDGYYFAGWFDEAFTTEYVDTITLTADTTVHAKWIKSTPIYDAEGLMMIAENPYGNYHLMANINLKGEEWTSIESFHGVLDGNGYKVYNFTLRQNNVNLAFIINNYGTVKNIVFANIEISNTASGNANYSIGAVCAYNNGSLLHVTAEKVDMLVNVSNTNVNNTVSIGMIAGENNGIIHSCSAQSEFVYKQNLNANLHNGSYATYIYIGGIAGKNSGTVSNVTSDFKIDANEYVYAFADATSVYNSATKYAYLHIGGLTGGEYGTLNDSGSAFACIFYSNAAGANAGYYAGYNPARYTYIGGAVGSAYNGANIEKIATEGSSNLCRVGLQSNSYEFSNGGIIGKVAGGTVSNCISYVDLTFASNSFGGMSGGIVGHIAEGKVNNAAYYGNITTEAVISGYFGGLAGRVDGTFTKGYFNGNIFSNCTDIAGIAAYITSTASVSKSIANGNIQTVYAASSGSAKNNYIIGVDYGPELLFDRDLLFNDLYLYEADIWGIDENVGLYLLSFPVSITSVV